MPWKNRDDGKPVQFFKAVSVEEEYFDASDITKDWGIYAVDTYGNKGPQLSTYAVRESLKDAVEVLGKPEILSKIEGSASMSQVYDAETVEYAKKLFTMQSVLCVNHYMYKSKRTKRKNAYCLGLKQAEICSQQRKLEAMRRNKRPRYNQTLSV